MANKRFYSWDNVKSSLDAIEVAFDKFNPQISYVSGIPRGGLIPAVLASHRFNLKYLDFEAAKNLPINQRESVLVFDDIVDSGVTFKEIEDFNFTTAALIHRSGSVAKPDFCGDYIREDDWIVFPWEREDSNTIQDYLIK